MPIITTTVNRADLRQAVRWNLDDSLQWSETTFSPEPGVVVYPIPKVGPMITNSEIVDIDGVIQTRGVNYTPYYEASQLVFTSAPVGGSIHIKWQFARFTDESLNEDINEAIRDLAHHYPKFGKYHRIAKKVQTATVTDNPLSATATTVNVTSTSGYDAGPGLFTLGNAEWVYYTGTTSTSFTGCQRQWSGKAVSMPINSIVTQDDASNRGFFVVTDDAGGRVRYVWGLRWYDTVSGLPSDGWGFVDTSDFHYDRADGFLTLEGDFDPDDNFEVLVGSFYTLPIDDVTPLDIPDEAVNAVGWLASANALASREPDRDLAAIENTLVDTQGNPPGASLRTADNFRKRYDDWSQKIYRAWPSRKRRMYIL